MFNGVEDAFEYGNMLEWLVNCFLKLLKKIRLQTLKCGIHVQD